MADDIDSLLDEVESKYCSSNERNHRESETIRAKLNANKTSDSLTEAIDDICSVPEPLENESLQTPSLIALRNSGIKQRCFTLHLGGTSVPLGICTQASKRACDHLRCISCDFSVSIFENYEWDSKVDYLFLRNNMPEFERVQSMLKKKPGTRAYACQCKYQSVSVLEDVHSEGLRWICGQH